MPGGEMTGEQDAIPPSVREAVRKRLMEDLSGASAESGVGIETRVEEALLSLGHLWPRRLIEALSEDVEDELFGLGPLEPLLRDESTTEIMINGPEEVYVERAGRLERVGLRFESGSRVVELVRRVIGPLNLRLDETSPMVDARLPDGSRLNAVVPPLSLNGPVVTIRRFRSDPFTSDELVRCGTLNREVESFLEEAVRTRANVLVSGGTSSGKTTLLNVLASFIPRGERLITIEDAAELRIPHPHVVSLESRPPNIEGRGEITVRQLVRNALRMRPDRIIVGEVRGPEALDMLQAMNTGHPGSLTTAHANSPRDLLGRLETMVMMADVGLDGNAVMRQIASSVDLIIHTERSMDGRRLVTEIASIACDGRGDCAFETLFQVSGGSRLASFSGLASQGACRQ